MSQKKKRKPIKSTPSAAPEKPRRVYLRDAVYIWATIGIVVGMAVLMIAFQLLGWFDNLVGSILSIVMGVFLCACMLDVGLLLSACITVGSGMVNAGKDERDNQMVFHAVNVESIEVRDREDRPMTEPQKVYKNCYLTFHMASGRTNRRKLHRLTQTQLERVRAAIREEQRA